MEGTWATRGVSTSLSLVSGCVDVGAVDVSGATSPFAGSAALVSPDGAAVALFPLTFRDVFPDAKPLRFALPNQ
jgi:hypothetical protein